MTSDSPSEETKKGIDTVGIVGVGRTGSWFVTKLNRAEYEIVVFDVDPEAAAAAVEGGATVADNPAELTAKSDVVVLCLPTKEDVEIVMEGSDGVLDSLESGQVVVDTGTTTPDLDVIYQSRCQELGAGYVDCGITRHGPGEGEREQEPAYTMFVGGDTDDYQQVRPVIETLGYEHEFFEGIGNGHVVKAAVALRGICRAVIAAEVSEFLENNGISPDRVIDLLDWEVPESYADPPYLTNRGFEQAVHGDAETPDRRGFDVDDSGARTRLDTTDWAKDPAYALAVARASNSYVPLLTAAHQTALLAENYGRALTDRELAFDDEKWHLFHLRSLYRSLSRPQEEWRRLDQWE